MELLMMTCMTEAVVGEAWLKSSVLLAALVKGKRMRSNSQTLLPACTSTQLSHIRALARSIFTVRMAVMWIGSRSKFHNTLGTGILSG